MTETASAAASPDQSHRIDAIDPPWRARPAIMAAICAVAGIIFYNLVDGGGAEAAAAFVAVATTIFVLTVEQRRLHWALLFAVGWGMIIALIVENVRDYNETSTPFEWPFWSGLLAVAVAAPLFQTWRDVAVDVRAWRWWQLPYDRLHLHAWTDAVIGAAAGIFVGISFALAWLIAGLFNLIGIDALSELLQEGWFVMALVGAAFGGAVGLLRERDRLVGTLQKLVMVVLSVLAPVLAAALALFLVSILGTGLSKLWDSGFSAAALMLGASAFAILLANAVIGNGAEDRMTNPVLRWAAPVLVVAVLPLTVIALYAMLMRIGQYGWTPERLWGIVAVIVGLGYGLAGLWSVLRGRGSFDDLFRPLQQKLAIGLMLIAAFLALPILDFGAISARDQLARLERGAVKLERFDWAAMAFDFGPDGRAALTRLSKSTDKARAAAAKVALMAESRWELSDGYDRGDEAMRPIEEMVRILPAGQKATPEILAAIRTENLCRRHKCIVYFETPQRIAVIGRYNEDSELQSQWFAYEPQSKSWARDYRSTPVSGERRNDREVDLERAGVTKRPVTLQQLVVDGQPVGEPYAEVP